MMSINGYIWNQYLPHQYIWDRTCGYHAVKNTINIINMINDFYIKNKTNNDNNYFNQLLCHYNKSDFNNKQQLELARNYYVYLNNGAIATNVNNLLNIKNNILTDNKIYFWNFYEDRVRIKSLINNKVNGVFGFIVPFIDSIFKHWYGVVIDIKNNIINLHLLDSFGIINKNTSELNEILQELNIDIKWNNYYNQYMSYLYKVYQVILFVVVYFVIIYGVLFLYDNLRKSKLS